MSSVIWKGRDITGLVLSVTVEHDLAAAGREARVQALCAPQDGRFAPLNPTCGDAVTVTAAGAELFAGRVERVEWDSAGTRLELVCLEPSALLANNEVYRAFSGRPADIAAQLCRLCGLPVGSLWDKPGSVFLPPTCGKSLLALLREASRAAVRRWWCAGRGRRPTFRAAVACIPCGPPTAVKMP